MQRAPTVLLGGICALHLLSRTFGSVRLRGQPAKCQTSAVAISKRTKLIMQVTSDRGAQGAVAALGLTAVALRAGHPLPVPDVGGHEGCTSGSGRARVRGTHPVRRRTRRPSLL